MVLHLKEGYVTIIIEFILDCSLLFVDVSSVSMLPLSVRLAVVTTDKAY